MTSEVTGEDVAVAGWSATRPAGDASSTRRVRIAVDLLGGDQAPAVVVDGALRALNADPDLHLLLVGPRRAAEEILNALDPAEHHRVGVRVADGSVSMNDPPSRGADPGTSVCAAALAHAEGEVEAIVSAGSSGAIVTAAVLALGRLEGVRKPALAAWVPTSTGRDRLLLDVGGSVESTVTSILSHAALGVAYANRHGLIRPRVGLLSVGSEPGKGDRVRRAAERALHQAQDRIAMRFVGLVEGSDVCLGDRADIVVTDGFTGNVLLKGIEGAYRLAQGRRQVSRAAALLGVPGIVVVCHGAAAAEDIASGVAFARGLAHGGAEGSAQPKGVQ